MFLVVCLALAACLEVLSRYAEKQELFSVLITDSISILAFLVFAVTVISGILHVCSIPRIRGAIILGVCLIILHQGTSLFYRYGLPACFPNQPGAALIVAVLGEVLWLTGFACVLGGFFFSLLEAQAARDQLARKHTELLAETEQRERLEAALRKSEERFRQVAENAKERIWEVNAEGLYTYSSPVVETVLGYKPEEIVGKKHFYDLFHPEDREDLKRTALAVFADKRPFHGFINRNVGKNGEPVWFSTSGIPLLDDHGALAGYRGADTDVTERKRAEEALRESEAKFRTLAETAPDVIYIYQDTRFRYVNPASTKMAGYTLEEFLAMDFWDVVHPDFRDLVRERGFARLRGEPVLPEYEFKILTKQGEERWVSANVAAIEFEGKSGVLGVAHDITGRRRAEEERRQLEAQILHAQKLESLGVLAGGIAHDFNNLLMGMLGNADLALMDLPPESPVRCRVEGIVSAAHRAAELTNQMLAYAGKGRFVVEPLDVSRLVQEIAHLLEASVSKKAVLRYDLAKGLPAITADATQLRQVAMNLIINASEAIGDETGVISVATGVVEADRGYLAGAYLGEDLPEGSYVYLAVADTGCGMDAGMLAKVFDPFFTTKFAGRGLGLAAVLGIMRGHRGAIAIQSRPGYGTTFRVLFPVAECRVAAVSEKPQRETQWRASGVVLVVDDEGMVRRVAEAMLRSFGFSALTASDGREGLRVFCEQIDKVVVVLLDMTMPQMNGEETLREMQRIRPDVRVIVSSGYSEEEATRRFAGKGIAGFIQKPYQAADLAAKLQAVLGPDGG